MSVCVPLFTCGKTCVVPRLCLGAASLGVFPLSRGWICRDDGLHKHVPGTRDSDTVLRHCAGSDDRQIGGFESSNHANVDTGVRQLQTYNRVNSQPVNHHVWLLDRAWAHLV